MDINTDFFKQTKIEKTDVNEKTLKKNDDDKKNLPNSKL